MNIKNISFINNFEKKNEAPEIINITIYFKDETTASLIRVVVKILKNISNHSIATLIYVHNLNILAKYFS
jgi:hypothetical protein